MALLATVQPTSKFGEMFQYSNLLAAAAGFVGGHMVYPKLELGAADDKALQTLVFDPLKMKATTFDYARAQRGDHAVPHGLDVDGKIAYGPMIMNYGVAPMRPPRDRPGSRAACDRPRATPLVVRDAQHEYVYAPAK